MNIAMTMNFIMVKRCVSTSCVSVCHNVRQSYSYHQQKVIVLRMMAVLIIMMMILMMLIVIAIFVLFLPLIVTCRCCCCFCCAHHLPWDLTNQIDGKKAKAGDALKTMPAKIEGV